MNRLTYIVISTVCCFFVLLAVLARYVYENGSIASELVLQKTQIKTMDSQIESLQSSLEESSLFRQSLTAENRDLRLRSEELASIFETIDKESKTLSRTLAEVQGSLVLSQKQSSEWKSKFEELSYSVSGDNYLARLIRQMSKMKTEVLHYEGVLKDKVQEIVELKMDLYALKSHAEGGEITNDIIVDLSEELASERKRYFRLSTQADELIENKNALSQKNEFLEKNQVALVTKYEEKIKALNVSADEIYRDLSSKTEENDVLREKLQRMVGVFTDQVNRINLTKSALDTEVGRANEMIEQEKNAVILPPLHVFRPANEEPEIRIFSENAAPAFSSKGRVKGKILSANLETQDFVIIDKGLEDGLSKGLLLDVWDSNRKIAELSVVQTRTNVSAAKIEKVIGEVKIREGDTFLVQ